MDGQQAASKWDALYDDRDQHRERVFRGVRGWLRKKSSPRLTVLFLFLICVVPCVGAAWWIAARQGSDQFGRPQAVGVLLAWPFFMLLLRRRAGVESRRMDLSDDWREFLLHDNAAQADEVRGLFAESNLPSAQNVGRALQGGLRSGNGNGILILFLLGVLSSGIWLVWSLVRSSPTLLAGIILDGEMVPRHPDLARRIGSEEWYKEASAITGFHFFGLILVMLIVGYFCSFIPLLMRETM